MSFVTFNYKKKEYKLSKDNCSGFYNDDEKPVEGFAIEEAIQLLKGNLPYIDTEYYDSTCEMCHFKHADKEKTFPFIEMSFSIFTKEGKYILSSLSEDYEDMSYGKLEKSGSVDSMYIVMLVVCPECNDFTIELSWVK